MGWGFDILKGLKVEMWWHQTFASNMFFMEINASAELPLCARP